MPDSVQTAAPLKRLVGGEAVAGLPAARASFCSLSSSSSSWTTAQLQPGLWAWALGQRCSGAAPALGCSVGPLGFPEVTKKSRESSGRGTGEEMAVERLEVPNLGRSGSGTGDDMDGERLEAPSLGERLVLLGGMGGLRWGLGCEDGERPASEVSEGELKLGLGQRKAGLLGSLHAEGLKWQRVPMAESGLLR